MQRSSTILLLAVALAALGPVGPAAAEVVTLQPVADNTLIETEDGSLSNGADDHFFAGNTSGNGLRRAVLQFDVAGAIPAGATIDSVTLTLQMDRSQRAGTETFTLHRVLADWGEGTSVTSGQGGGGAASTPGSATWQHTFYPSSFWTSDGGDFVATASASLPVTGNASYTWGPTAGMAADVQAWLDTPGSDFGWALLGNEAELETAKRFASREHSTATSRPQLQVTFTPGSIAGACCAADGSCSVPGGLAECTGQGGTYQGDGVSCTPNPCPPPVGACCLPTPTATCSELDEASCTGQGGTWQGALSACTDSSLACPVVLTPYLDPLPRPAVAQPVSGAPGDAASYVIAMRETQQQLHAELAGPTTVWGYDAGSGTSYPGPTIEAKVGAPITVTWQNDLRDISAGNALRTSHYLPVDTCPHGAAENADARVVVHVHGAHVASESDGYPELAFPPGQQVVYEYPNWQLPGTIWYHDHALGITRLNVYMGLAGIYLIRDAFEASLGLPSGEYEIPLAVQDRSFHPDGSLQYPAVWQEMFLGNTILVNGKVWPYLNVDRGKYRFRLLNGSTSRTYTFGLDSGAPFTQIGAEGGLLPAPAVVSQITLGPGERADVIVDFASHAAGTEIVLTNSAPAPFPGDPGVGVIPNVMKFIVGAATGHTAAVPSALRPMEVLDEADASVHREFHLEKGPANACSPFEWHIVSVVDGAPVGSKWVDITEFPELGETEVWSYVNRSGMTHPMHMHLVMFQVLDRQAFEEVDGVITPIGAPVPPPPGEAGWKDTVQVGPSEIVRVIARFENYVGRYPYHCHILEHEDHEMMRQFQSVATTPACSDGLDNDGDGFVDHAGGDPGCDSPTDLSERSPTLECDDGIDNDGDGLWDYPDDPGCEGPGGVTELPEPPALLGLMACGVLLAALARRRRRAASFARG